MASRCVKAESTGFDAQDALIRSADETADITEAITPTGLSIDDLVYENSKSLKWKGGRPRALSSFDRVGQDVPIVSFFTGCGGMDLGFEAVGFKHVAAFELIENFCKTLRLNRPDWNVFGPPFHSGDVSKYDDVLKPFRRRQ